MLHASQDGSKASKSFMSLILVIFQSNTLLFFHCSFLRQSMSAAGKLTQQDTFFERLRYFGEITNPFYLVYGERDVQWAKAEKRTDEQPLADRILRVAAHPESRETIPRPFRLGAAIPANIVISAAMAHPAIILSFSRSAIVHWLNQTYNCAVNFANRNQSSDVDMSNLARTYCAACTLSVGIALTATLIMRRYQLTGWRLTGARGIFPMVAASTASVVNVCMIRRSEWIDDGVSIYDEHGEYRGISLAAGAEGIWKCSVTRALSNIPIVTLPVFFVAALQRFGAFRPSLRLDLACVLCGVSCGIPACLALYPQRERIAVSRLEPKFHNMIRSRDKLPVTTVFYNKGL